MSKKKAFKPFSDEKQKDYEREIRLQYGSEPVNKSIKTWNSYSKKQQEEIMDEGNAIYSDLVKAIEDGKRPQGKRVQGILQRWHQHLHYFYAPSLELLRGLGEMYTTHPDFIANFKKLHPELGDFMKLGIEQYVDDLETLEIKRMLFGDESQHKSG